jgi:hypothetical protein
MRQRDQGTSLKGISIRNMLKLRGSVGDPSAGLRKAFYGLRGYDQVSGKDTSSDNDRMSYRHKRIDTITESPGDVRGRYRF